MRKTHTFLEKIAQSLIEIPSDWFTLLTVLQKLQTDHIISVDDDNEQELKRTRGREKMRGLTQEWNREEQAGRRGCCSVRGERKRVKKMVFILCQYNIKIILIKKNIKIINRSAIVSVHICTSTSIYTQLCPNWCGSFFCSCCVKWSPFSILHNFTQFSISWCEGSKKKSCFFYPSFLTEQLQISETISAWILQEPAERSAKSFKS